MDPYRFCACGEFRAAALRNPRKGEIAGCLNCTAPPTYPKDDCQICQRRGLPVQGHHVAGSWASDLVIPVCLNCHALVHEMKRGLDHALRELAGRSGLEWVPLFVGRMLCILQHMRHVEVIASDTVQPTETLQDSDNTIVAIIIVAALIIATMLSESPVCHEQHPAVLL